MFIINVEKCKKIFKKVYVSSDSDDILKQAVQAGAIPIKRGTELCGDTPNIPVYRYCVRVIPERFGAIDAVQANSPSIDPQVIKTCKTLIEAEQDEVMTCHEDRTIYGSVWAIRRRRLSYYRDFYNPIPGVLVVDTSTDIHTLDDYKLALKEYNEINGK
jgi:CMP-N-acetylneuraminic acid synthetase